MTGRKRAESLDDDLQMSGLQQKHMFTCPSQLWCGCDPHHLHSRIQLDGMSPSGTMAGVRSQG